MQTNFFSLQPSWEFGRLLNSYTSKYLSLIIVISIIIINLSSITKNILKRRVTFFIPIAFLLISNLCIEFWSSISYQQSFFSSFTASYYYYLIILYYYLVTLITDKSETLRMFTFIITLSGIYSFLLILQDLLLNKEIEFMNIGDTGLGVEVGNNLLGFLRIKAPADFIAFGTMVIIVYMLIDSKKTKQNLIPLTINTVYLVVVSQTRMYIITILILEIFMVLYKVNKINKVFTVVFMYIVGFFGIAMIPKIFSTFINGERKTSYTVRIEAINFYFNEISLRKIVGIGFPNTFSTEYLLHGGMLNILGYQYYLDDIGILGFIVTFGVVGYIILGIFIIQLIREFMRTPNKLVSLVPISYILLTSISLSLVNVQRIIYLPFILFIISFIRNEGDKHGKERNNNYYSNL